MRSSSSTPRHYAVQGRGAGSRRSQTCGPQVYATSAPRPTLSRQRNPSESRITRLVSLLVQKFGGSSVTDVAAIARVAQRVVDTKRAGHDVAVVVSAMGDTTDELLDLAKAVSQGPPPEREMDILLTAGERISMALLAMAIEQLGERAFSFTGDQAGMRTDRSHGRARLLDVTPGRIQRTLEANAIAIVAGFQGISEDEDVTTLGRGGSDTTAVALVD